MFVRLKDGVWIRPDYVESIDLGKAGNKPAVTMVSGTRFLVEDDDIERLAADLVQAVAHD
jgi:hypothetical protein